MYAGAIAGVLLVVVIVVIFAAVEVWQRHKLWRN